MCFLTWMCPAVSRKYSFACLPRSHAGLFTDCPCLLGDRRGRVADPVPLPVERKMIRAKPIRDGGLEREAAGFWVVLPCAGACSGGVPMPPVALAPSATSQMLFADKCFVLDAADRWLHEPLRVRFSLRVRTEKGGAEGRGTTAQRSEPRSEHGPAPHHSLGVNSVSSSTWPSERPHSSPHWQRGNTCRRAGPLAAW